MSIDPKYKGKRIFTTADKVKETNFDTIIIGSGIGGMTCASALAKFGQKVLIIE